MEFPILIEAHRLITVAQLLFLFMDKKKETAAKKK